MLKISKTKITYFIDLELSSKEEEILESIASSYAMTLSEYIRFLIKKKIRHREDSLERGVRLLAFKRRNSRIF